MYELMVAKLILFGLIAAGTAAAATLLGAMVRHIFLWLDRRSMRVQR
jgi:FtsH-binding integral membrane protein